MSQYCEMTLIRFHKRGAAAILGADIAISTTGNFRPARLQLPLLPRGEIVSETSIVGKSQKIVEISENFFVAYSGTVIVARAVLRELRENIPYPTDIHEIMEVVKKSGLSQEEIDSIAMIFCWQFGGDNEKNRFSVNAFNTYAHEEGEETVLSEGSGDGHSRYLYEIHESGPLVELVSDPPAGDQTVFHDELLFFSNPILEEMTGRENLQFNYGGFFEFVTNHDGYLKKRPLLISICQRIDPDRDDLNLAHIFSLYNDTGDLFIFAIHEIDEGKILDYQVITSPIRNEGEPVRFPSEIDTRGSLFFEYLYDIRKDSSATITGFSNESTIWLVQSGPAQIQMHFSEAFIEARRKFFNID
ncbi:MAG: hypothetical protein ACQEUZ_12710 [Pseudomonadota bacterium]